MASSMDPFRNLRNRTLSEPYQQQAMIILSAIDEVHESKKSQPAPTTYFGAIMSSLDTKKQQQTPETLGGFMYLLSIVFPELPKGVVLKELETVSNIFGELLHKQIDHALVIKSVLLCVAILLPLLERHMWAFPYTLKLFRGLMAFTLDPRPPIRKLAQAALPTILASVSVDPQGIPKQVVEVFDSQCAHELKNCTPKKDCQVALYMCGALQQSVALVPASSVFAVLSPLIQLSGKSSNSVLRLQVFRTLQVFFEYDKPPVGKEKEGEEKLIKYEETSLYKGKNAVELVSKLLAMLMEVKPHQEDEMAAASYGSALVAGLARLTREQPLSVAKFLPDGFLLLADNLLSTKQANVKHALKHLKLVLEQCITPGLISQALGTQVTTEKHAFVSLVEHIESLLSFRYKNLPICPLLSQFFKQLNPSASPLVARLLQAMESLREQTPEITSVFGDAVASLGPAGVFAALPLTPNKENLGTLVKEGRWWLLPMLKHISEPKMSWFGNDMLPLAHTLFSAHNAAKEQKAEKEEKTLMELVCNLWSTFPYFCNLPSDSRESFPLFAKQLGSILTDDKFESCRSPVCKGIYALLTGNEETKSAVSPFAKKFLPILFNLALTDTSEHVLRLISVYAECDVELANALFKKVLKKLLEAGVNETDENNSSTSHLHGLTDILMSLVPILDHSNLSVLYKAVAPLISDENNTLQKKAYQILTITLEKHETFFTTATDSKEDSYAKKLLNEVVEAADKCVAGVQKHRLRCVRSLLLCLVPDVITDTTTDAFPILLGETILAIKEPNRKTRDTAFDLLVSLAVKTQETADESVMRNYIVVLMGGLAGKTPRMKGAAVLALTRVVYKFRTTLDPATLTEILTTVLLLLKDNAREVISAVLGFVKVCVLCLDPSVLHPHLPLLMEGLTVWCATSRNRFRMKTRVIFEMLLKRFNPETIKSLVPHKDHPLLEHILKTTEREARKKAEAWAQKGNKPKDSQKAKTEHDEFEEFLNDDDDDDDDDEEEKGGDKAHKGEKNTKMKKNNKLQKPDGKGSKKKKVEGGPVKMWIRDAEVDMLDPGALSQNVATVDPAISNAPKKGVKRSVDRRIYEDASGKIVVDPTKSRGKHRGDDSDDEEGGKKDGDDEDGEEKKEKKLAKKGSKRPIMKKAKHGDSLRKDGLEPFLFQKLDPTQLSRRKAGRAAGKFENLIGSAKRGANKGAKAAKRVQKSSTKKGTIKKGSVKKAKFMED